MAGWGAVFALISALFFGVSTTAAHIAHDAGATTEAIVLLRLILVAPVLFLALRWRGHGSLSLPAGTLGRTTLSALATLGVSLCYLASVRYIPVGLAALFFYTWPLMVAAGVAIRDRRLPNARLAAGFVLAFLGLALAIGPDLDGLDGRGAALALTAAACTMVIFMVSGRVLAVTGALKYAAWANLLGLPLMLVLLPVLGPLSPPATPGGWAGFMSVAICYLIAMTAMFAAIQKGGEQKTAMLFNLEPLVALTAAWVLLGEAMAPVQVAGAFLVVLALGLTRTPDGAKDQEKTPDT